MDQLFHKSQCLNPKEVKDYLNRNLDEGKQHRIENHLLDCTLCNDAVEGFAQNNNAIDDPQLTDLKNHFAQFEEAYHQEQPSQRQIIRAIASMAAISLLLITAIWLYRDANQSERLFYSQYETYEPAILSNTRSAETENTVNVIFEAATTAYQAKQYEESIPLFEKQLEQNPEHLLATLLLGSALLETGQSARALDHFETVRLNSDLYYEDATWYAILAAVRLENYPEANALIEDLLRLDSDFYREQALEIQGTIEGNG